MTKPNAKLIAAIIASILLLAPRAWAQSYTLAPPPFQVALDNNGRIINGACIWTYVASTTTPATTYLDNAGTTNTNPIRSDSAGRFTVYLIAGTNYKFVFESSCTPPAHGTTLRTADNIAGVPSSSATVDITGVAGETISAGQCAYLSDGSGSKVAGQFYKCDSTNPYSSLTPEVGLAPSAITSGASGTIRLSGLVTGLSTSVGSSYYISTSGAITTTAPTNKRFLGVADTATSMIVTPNPPSGPTTATITTTGTQTALTLPTGPGDATIFANNATLLTIQGIAAGSDGQLLTIASKGAGQVDFEPQSGSASAANRLINFATVGTTSLAAGSGVATYQYDATTARWRLIRHEQGAWITPTFAAGDFTAQAGNWTLTSGDVQRHGYRLSGRTVTEYLQVVTTTVSATPTYLESKIPGGFVAAFPASWQSAYNDNGAGFVVGISWIPAAAATKVRHYKSDFATAWAAAADTTQLFVTLTYEVQ